MTVQSHLADELRDSSRLSIQTKYGLITGGRAANDAAIFLEIPYALPPGRFEDPEPLPSYFLYDNKEYILESSYAVQPGNDGQAVGMPVQDKLGYGQPTENPLFLNIVCPPTFSAESNFPVKVYIHGGFLQFGSPHGLSSQAQYVAAERKEVWVNIGYRLSAFGFLACDEPKIDGNFGFKDQWLALEWIQDNISVFGGNPADITLTGLSAGAHSCHQLLHHASRLRAGQRVPFHRVVLQSNAIASTPKTPAELRPQFRALCHALDLDPDSPDVLSNIRDPDRTSWQSIVKAVEELGVHGTFRGSLDDEFLTATPDPMTWQRTGGFAKALREKGIKSILVGHLTEEWYLYGIAHPIRNPDDIAYNLKRYYRDDLVVRIMESYKTLPPDAGPDECEKLFGEILSDGQVHLPVRLLVRDLITHGFPVVRYEIRWTPEQVRTKGYVTHGTDRCLWALRKPVLDPSQWDLAKEWLDRVDAAVREVEKAGSPSMGLTEMLTLGEDKVVAVEIDQRWDDIIRLAHALPGE